MNKTSIEWTDYTWNPVTGCHKVSPGCKNCYAETLTNRFAKTWGVKDFREIVLHQDRIDEVRNNYKKWYGKKVFVCSMSDLFQDAVPHDFITRMWHEMYLMPNTIFQILTKRPERAIHVVSEIIETNLWGVKLPNVWIGTSCENQETANERIPHLLQIPAAVRFLSCEPLLEPINICNSIRSTQHPNEIHTTFFGDKIHWVIAGGESGHSARPMHPDWVRSLRDQCAAANVPFFFKQWGEWAPGSMYGPTVMCLNPDNKNFLFDALTTDGNFATAQIQSMYRSGKSKSGNLLDGIQHLNFPTL